MIATINLNWSCLPAKPIIGIGQVHLVSAVLPSDYDASQVDWSLLTDKERNRALRFKFDRHRNRWVFGRLTLKHLLSSYLNCEALSIELGYGEIGKPYVASPSNNNLLFNYTDSGGLLIYAFSEGIEVGVDLEFLPRETNFEALVRRKLTPDEQTAFYEMPVDHQQSAFLACWTRKEAYGKALGVGIRYPMSEVTLCENMQEAVFSLVNDDGDNVLLHQLQPPFSGIGCIASIAKQVEICSFSMPMD